MEQDTQYIEQLFLRANAQIDERNYEEAKSILEEILEIDPTYGRAYNHLGWIYSEILKFQDKAEPLYQMALKYSPNYGAPYVNYLYLLLDRYDTNAIEEISSKAEKVQEVDKGILNYIKGRSEELKGNMKVAYQLFEKAKTYSFNDRFITDMNSQKSRILSKLNPINKVIALLFW